MKVVSRQRFRFSLAILVVCAVLLIWKAGPFVERRDPSETFRAPGSQPAATADRARVLKAYDRLPLAFEVNRGQTDARVKFLAHGPGMSVFVLCDELVVSGDAAVSRESSLADGHAEFARKLNVLRIQFAGANRRAKIIGQDMLESRSNYFLGNHPSAWRVNIPAYEKVAVEQAYTGVDLVYYGETGNLEFDMVVHPGADPRRIALEFGGKEPSSGAGGSLIFGRGASRFILNRPRVFQIVGGRRVQVGARYARRSDGRVGIRFGKYDHSSTLVVDPTLSYASYLGGTGGEQGLGIAIDGGGNAYITGLTSSANFPLANPYQNTLNLGLQNAFVTEFRADGSKLIYSTYLGGNDVDQGSGIAVDSSGNAYITGYTTSTTFPVMNPIQGSLAGIQNAFATELKSGGSALVYSTYLGGSLQDLGTGIAVDSSGDAYVTGMTDSANFPLANALQNTLKGRENAFVTKIAAGGESLDFSTYLGGSDSDQAASIAVDSGGNAYVTGTASSTDFPIVGGFQKQIAGQSDAFIAKLNSSGSAITYSTFLGGADVDQGLGIAVDSSGNAYVTGSTSSPDFPTLNPVQGELASASDAFVSEVNANGSALVYSTFLGGTGGDAGFAIALDSGGNAYVTGQTRSKDFPILGAIQGTLGGSANSFIAEIAAKGSGLTFSTYYGGNGTDLGGGIGVDTSGNIIATGTTSSSNLLITGGVQSAYAGAGDAYVVKLSPTSGPGVALEPISLDFGTLNQGQSSQPMTVTLTNTGDASLSISGITVGGTDSADFAQTNTCSGSLGVNANCTISVTFTPGAGGSLAAQLSIADNAPGNPQIVNLSGIGTAMIPQVTLSPPTLNFMNVTSGSSQPLPVTLVNNGSGVLTITSITITGNNKKDFSQTNDCGSAVSAGTSCTIMVTFTPQASGPRQAILEVTDNATNSPQLVSLQGGGSYVLSANPSSEQVAAGQSTSYVITISPLNNFNQMVTFDCDKPPAGVSCSFSPSMVTLDGTDPVTTNLTVMTTSRGTTSPLGQPRDVPPAAIVFLCAGTLLGAAYFLGRRRIWLAVAAAGILIIIAPGCGSSSTGPGTPAGQYQISVQGVSGTLTENTVISLTVN